MLNMLIHDAIQLNLKLKDDNSPSYYKVIHVPHSEIYIEAIKMKIS